MKTNYRLTYSDQSGNVFDHPDIEPLFRSGNQYKRIDNVDLIPLPYGSFLFSLPGRLPVYCNNGDILPIKRIYDIKKVRAVSAFLSSGYLRTYLPAYQSERNAQPLTLWAYCGVAFKDDGFYVPAFRVDQDPRSDPELHENDRELKIAIDDLIVQYGDNRLVKQLAYCATEYRCLCARNFFISRYEAPVPTTPFCNARCIGCLSYQHDASGYKQSQYRLTFQPDPDEIAEVILHHINKVNKPITSFGQGCEGEPLLRAGDLAVAIKKVRNVTDKGTIHINTNGSLPENLKMLIDAGLDSVRFSLNSPTADYYHNYYQPVGYTLDDVKRSIRMALDLGVFVSLNLFFMPGFTDMQSEVDELFSFLSQYKVNMIQTRNLNIDPDIYFHRIGYQESKINGIVNMIDMIKESFPGILLGYYNPAKENFNNR